jgi:NAD(P)-dependent dehydrogenase (short-subunit alcohol dehydrogenase family)
MSEIRFDDRVAIVTGAGVGLGRAHALLLASRGAKVVVNDPGGSVDGRGGATAVADQVVAEIKAAGGEAVANYDSVADKSAAPRIVQQAMDTWGRLDILIANAGILRDKAFHNMEIEDFEAVMQVHVMGTVYPLKAAWPIFRERKYGRVVVTTSSSGTVGNFGQSNYGAAKNAVIGLIHGLRLEGARYNILINAISPQALTRMTEGLLPPGVAGYLKPDLVSPAVAYLCSEECQVSGYTIGAGGGTFERVQYFITEGVAFDPDQPVTIEMIRDSFDEVCDLGTATPIPGLNHHLERKLRALGKIK